MPKTKMKSHAQRAKQKKDIQRKTREDENSRSEQTMPTYNNSSVSVIKKKKVYQMRYIPMIHFCHMKGEKGKTN